MAWKIDPGTLTISLVERDGCLNIGISYRCIYFFTGEMNLKAVEGTYHYSRKFRASSGDYPHLHPDRDVTITVATTTVTVTVGGESRTTSR